MSNRCNPNDVSRYHNLTFHTIERCDVCQREIDIEVARGQTLHYAICQECLQRISRDETAREGI